MTQLISIKSCTEELAVKDITIRIYVNPSSCSNYTQHISFLLDHTQATLEGVDTYKIEIMQSDNIS